MNKLAKAIKAISLLLKKPALLNHVLDSNEVMQHSVQKKYNLENGLPQVDLLTLFPSFHSTVEPYSFLDGTSSPLDLALLRSLAKDIPSCRYFEIGTWRGESVANVAAVAKECITLNLPDDEMRKLGMNEEYISLHRFFSAKLPNVQHLQHNSSTFNFNSIGRFDLIFVDGDHHYEQVSSDTQNVFTLLNNEQSVIVWHDYVNHSGEVRYPVLAGILDGCPDEFRSNLYHVSNTMCALFTRKKFLASSFNPYPKPKNFSVEILVRSL